MVSALSHPDLRVLHVDLDAFFAAVEQRQRPSLRGRPVIVGGVSGRGVVATASYEARPFGVSSAMAMAHARRACPDGVFLSPRFEAYRAHSVAALGWLFAAGATVEQVAFDEAFVDLSTVPDSWWDPVSNCVVSDDPLEPARRLAGRVRATIYARTGLSSAVGVGRSKLTAKLGSEAGKPGGITVIDESAESDLLPGLDVRALWGVGPATAARLEQYAVRTVADVRSTPLDYLATMVGKSHAALLADLARGVDERPVVASSERKSVGAEHTLSQDLYGRTPLHDAVRAAFNDAHKRLRRAKVAARTVTVKVRYLDFTDVSRAQRVAAPSDDAADLLEAALRAADRDIDITRGIRLVGVTFSTLTEHAQPALAFCEADAGRTVNESYPVEPLTGADDGGESDDDAFEAQPVTGTTAVGADVAHRVFGPGWVVKVAGDRVTVRFETPNSAPGRDQVFALGDPALVTATPPDPAPYPEHAARP